MTILIETLTSLSIIIGCIWIYKERLEIKSLYKFVYKQIYDTPIPIAILNPDVIITDDILAFKNEGLFTKTKRRVKIIINRIRNRYNG